MTCYDILEINQDASQDEIKEAYRQKTLEEHPDHSDHPNATQRFIQIKEAYDILSDPKKRDKYDRGKISGPSTGMGDDDIGGQSTGMGDDDIGGQSTGTGDDEINWRAYTRGTESAEQMCHGEQKLSEKPPGVGEIDGTKTKLIAGTIVAGAAGAILGLEIAMYIVSFFNPPMSIFFTDGASVFGLLLLTIVFVVMIIGIEKLLGTHRQILKI